ncbi:hypothetical protein RUM44_001220 [Polyplax serrata]|uniref:Uncharacterized protein n=1 Tax=Polyplax serrata TaxID=468196 RepID=A0ABR1B6U3_POLSC
MGGEVKAKKRIRRFNPRYIARSNDKGRRPPIREINLGETTATTTRAEKKPGGGRKTGNPIHKTEFKPIKLRKDNNGKDAEADEISREKDTRVLFYGTGEKTTAMRLMQEDVEDGSTRKGRLAHVSHRLL